MHATLTSLLASYGYVVLFLLVTLESLGIPLPGETALVTAAAFAAAGHLSISGVIMTAVVAAILGDNGGYWIGRAGSDSCAVTGGYCIFAPQRSSARTPSLHGMVRKPSS